MVDSVWNKSQTLGASKSWGIMAIGHVKYLEVIRYFQVKTAAVTVAGAGW